MNQIPNLPAWLTLRRPEAMSEKEWQQRGEVIARAITWLRTPYANHGHIKGAGVDCVALLVEAYGEAEILTGIDPGNYNPQWHLHHSEELYVNELLKYCNEIESNPQPGDVAMFRFGRTYSHGALVIEWPFCIHAFNPSGCEYTNAEMEPLAGRLVRFFTLKEWP